MQRLPQIDDTGIKEKVSMIEYEEFQRNPHPEGGATGYEFDEDQEFKERGPRMGCQQQ